MRQELGINLLVYKEKLDQGTAQSTLLKAIKDQGISLAEVRIYKRSFRISSNCKRGFTK